MRAAVAALLFLAVPAEARVLRVCADPNNMPFSNRAGEGFENRIMTMIAQDLGAQLQWVWRAQRRGNVRETLNAGACDVIPGVASSLEMLATTRPYYRSAYVAVQPAGAPRIDGFDSPRLKTMRIGVQLVGDDGSNTPPAHALSRRGHIANVRGFLVQGAHDRPDPQRAIVDAVASGRLDIAFVWGPVAGYFGSGMTPPIEVTRLAVTSDGAQLPIAFDISMGVRKSDAALRRALDAALDRRAPGIMAVLTRYNVPLMARE